MLALLAIAVAAEPGTVEQLIAQALDGHPAVRAQTLRQQAATSDIASARALPDPTVSAGVYLQSVETRVGPQQARLGVQQAIPWPGTLVHGAQAASAEATAMSHVQGVVERSIVAEVRLAYWTVWEVRRSVALHREHLTVLDGLAETVRARIELGQASLAELQQVDLARARLEDLALALEARERAEIGRLEAAVGRSGAVGELTSEPAVVGAGRADLAAHPVLAAADAQVTAADHRARAAAAARWPDFSVRADWIITGPAEAAGIEGSGKDAVMVGVGLQVPVWQGTHARRLAAARHTESALRQDREATLLGLQAELDAVNSVLADSERRVALVRHTLLPQAEAAYLSILGEVATGSQPTASALLAQRDLLELAVELVAEQARNARASARADALTGGADGP